MPHGKFLVVEGGEGSGKTSHITALKQAVSAEEVVFSREPGGTDLSEEVRRILLFGDGKAGALTNFFLFSAARSDHMDRVLAPALDQGKHVVCDRFDGSTYAYQICGQENRSLHQLFLQVRSGWKFLPDLYIFLDVSPEEGIRRRSAQAEQVNTFDQKKLDFHHRVREGYLEFVESYPHVVIDANRSIDQVREDFLRITLEYLGVRST